MTRITKFVEEGGGYIGYCGTSTLAAEFKDKPRTIPEMMLNYIDLQISRVKIIYNINLPFIAGKSNKPNSIGQSAYLYYSGTGVFEKGIPLDVVIDKNNPIFDDFIGDKRRIHWLGGPAYEVNNQENDKIDVLAYYPKEDISDNVSTQIHYWEYDGDIRDFFISFLKLVDYGFKLREALEYTRYLASDWDMTDRIIETNYSNKPFMTMEEYPNENQARIILCGGHPEYYIWWGGYVEDVPDTDQNNLVEGLYQWKDKIPTNETIEDEEKYNWWIVRRHTAWASKKVLDNNLPPIYDVSEVSDIYPYARPSNFSIIGNSVISDGVESLDLYYRYSNDNSTWTTWTLYNTDIDESNGWSWDFSSPNGIGFYQFYSLKHVRYNHLWMNETVPPGPDAIACIQIE